MLLGSIKTLTLTISDLYILVAKSKKKNLRISKWNLIPKKICFNSFVMQWEESCNLSVIIHCWVEFQVPTEVHKRPKET